MASKIRQRIKNQIGEGMFAITTDGWSQPTKTKRRFAFDESLWPKSRWMLFEEAFMAFAQECKFFNLKFEK